MKKAAIVLIVIGIVVVIAANLFIRSQPEPIPPPSRDDTTLRSTTAGDVVGFRDRFGARSWQGIPFAAAPVGANRWRAPQLPDTYDTVLEALAPGQMCPQLASQLSGSDGTSGAGAIAGDEDCLYLNIWSPPNAVRLPVMYWIHGGGNTLGHGGSYNGAALAVNREVVVVTINYRLGFFGWFSHPALASGNPLDDSGNYGTLDAIRGLQWVQDNIHAFGGDADNVTAFGESAGGMNAYALLLSPMARNLFHRAISQSGILITSTLASAENAVDDPEPGSKNSSTELLLRLLQPSLR